MKENASHIKKRIFELIQIGNRNDAASRICDYILVLAIFINLIFLVLETFIDHFPNDSVIKIIEQITVLIFMIEYILRIWTADLLYPNINGKFKSKLKFIFSFFGIIDLLSILPAVLFFLPSGFVALRMLRVIRVFRLFRVNAQYDAFNVMFSVLKEKKNQLLSSVCLILIMILSSSLFMYNFEHNAQPDVFKDAFSGIWWSVSTVFTIGYGDIFPITIPGQILAIIIAFLGVGLVAIPTGIISAGFVEQYTKMKTISETAEKKDITFINLTIESGHPWENKKIRDIPLPTELIIVVIVRDNKVIIPNGNIVINENDRVVLGAIEFQDDIGIIVKDSFISENHMWNGQLVKDLAIGDNTIIVSIMRHSKALIPRGNTRIELGDIVTVCEKKIN